VQHNRTGLLVPPNDAQALAAAMRRIVSEPGLRASLGADGFALAARSLNARLQSAKLETLLLSVAAGDASQMASDLVRRDASPRL